jgi:guanylate kinase
MDKKVIIFSAPSGAGKSTIVGHLIKKYPFLEFSISATSRQPRGSEKNGIEYYFFTTEQFEQLINKGAFIEFEEVYSGSYYGTLRSEMERIWDKGNVILFDIDVKGGLNIKRLLGNNALSVFVRPPSVDELQARLQKRNTDTPEAIAKRVAKAQEELTYEEQFDYVLVNDDLQTALDEAERLIENFTGRKSK